MYVTFYIFKFYVCNIFYFYISMLFFSVNFSLVFFLKNNNKNAKMYPIYILTVNIGPIKMK